MAFWPQPCLSQLSRQIVDRGCRTAQTSRVWDWARLSAHPREKAHNTVNRQRTRANDTIDDVGSLSGFWHKFKVLISFASSPIATVSDDGFICNQKCKQET